MNTESGDAHAARCDPRLARGDVTETHVKRLSATSSASAGGKPPTKTLRCQENPDGIRILYELTAAKGFAVPQQQVATL
jgi:hypothetical protein